MARNLTCAARTPESAPVLPLVAPAAAPDFVLVVADVAAGGGGRRGVAAAHVVGGLVGAERARGSGRQCARRAGRTSGAWKGLR